MCGKAYDPRLMLAWPTAKIAVMGGEQAAQTLLQIKVSSLGKDNNEISPEKKKELLKQITDHYNSHTTPYYAASQLWVDKIIDPFDTRQIISSGIEAANHAPITKPFNVGVIQT